MLYTLAHYTIPTSKSCVKPNYNSVSISNITKNSFTVHTSPQEFKKLKIF